MSDKGTDWVTNADIQSALCADKGSEAQLVSWLLEDFTSKFDGCMALIKNVRVRYSVAGQTKEVCYVLKVNPSRGEDTNYFKGLLFTKEIKFYSEVIPALNAVLEEIGYALLSCPKCFYYKLEKGKELLLLENLKVEGFRMEHKGLGVGATHASLVLKELAKLHAAWVLLQAKTPEKDLFDRFECVQKEWSHEFNNGGNYGNYIDGLLEISLHMFERFGGCEKVINWIKKIRPNASKMHDELLEKISPFAVITHGDCWVNNLMFRHDSSSNPVEVKIIDFEFCRKASLALDLQHFITLNVPGPERREKLPLLLATYHTAFDEVMKAGGSEVPFTLEELRQEYIARGFYGVLYSIMWFPDMVRTPEEETDNENTDSDGKDAQLKNVLKMADHNPLLKSKVMSVVEEWTEFGLIS